MRSTLRIAALAGGLAAAALLASPRPGPADCTVVLSKVFGALSCDCDANTTVITDFHDSSVVWIDPELLRDAYGIECTGAAAKLISIDTDVRPVDGGIAGAYLELRALGSAGAPLASFRIERVDASPRPFRLSAVGSDGRAARLTLARVGASGTGAGGSSHASIARVASWPSHLTLRREKSGVFELTCAFAGGASVVLGEEEAPAGEAMRSRELRAILRAPAGKPVPLTAVAFRAFGVDSVGVRPTGLRRAGAKAR